jgi:hypothetical protein
MNYHFFKYIYIKMDITYTNNYYDRINNYKKINNKFNKLNENQCLTFGKKINKYYEYYLNDKQIFLKKKIGSESRYGVIFLTSSDFSTTTIFATKLMVVDNHNYIEIILSKKLSNITLKDLNPHFLLVYKSFKCDNINSSNKKLPSLIKKHNYFITINELADDNLKNFLISENDPDLIANTYQQILLSILSFHYHTKGIYHRDCHYKNFLYHKIEKGGYFHYKIFGKDIYIENKGYIWMIWDFGLAKIEEYQKIDRLNDYFKINDFFRSSKSYSNSSKFNLISSSVSKLNSIEFNYKDIIGNSDVLLFNNYIFPNTKLFQTTYDSKSFIINKKPYTIKNF